MNIVEKLGIEGIEAHYLQSSITGSGPYCREHEVRKLEKQRNEMLEDGLYNCQLIERMKSCILEPDKLYIMIGQMKTGSYEKATGKKYNKLKELLNE